MDHHGVEACQMPIALARQRRPALAFERKHLDNASDAVAGSLARGVREAVKAIRRGVITKRPQLGLDALRETGSHALEIIEDAKRGFGGKLHIKAIMITRRGLPA